jgi:hypothetical protein
MTLSTDTAPEILKQDKLGRVKTPAARREAILDEFERSGMSGAAFAGYIGMKCQTLASWVHLRKVQTTGAWASRPMPLV